jgi:hypothetical protein
MNIVHQKIMFVFLTLLPRSTEGEGDGVISMRPIPSYLTPESTLLPTINTNVL